MRIDWTPIAKLGWQEVADYIHKEFGDKALLEFEKRTYDAEKDISEMPNSGSIAWFDSEENVLYRFKHIYRRSKMLYFVLDNKIFIADFWDVRSNY